MILYELSPTLHWAPTASKSRATATVKTNKHTYELVVKCNKFVTDHIRGWVSKVIAHEKDVDAGRYVELTCKDNRESFAGVDDIRSAVASGIAKHIKSQDLSYVYLFSSKPSRRETFEKLAKQIAKKLDWDVYQDRNYFLIHNPTLDVVQPD